MKSEKPPMSMRTRRAILEQLKQAGPTDSAALAKHFGFSAMAIRQHLYDLQKSGFVTFVEQSRPLGRPAKLWCLTPAADQFFPDRHADLTVDIINAFKQTFGEEGLSQVISARAKQQIDTYRKRLPMKGSLSLKLKILAQIRKEEGYMAEVESQKDGSFLLIENHCPICVAAKNCMRLCGAELEVFKAVLGKGILIERTEHILGGARRCTYKVSQS